MVDDPDRCLATIWVRGEACPVTRLLDIDGAVMTDPDQELWEVCKIEAHTPDGRLTVFEANWRYLKKLH